MKGMGFLKSACDFREVAVGGHGPGVKRWGERRRARLEEEMRKLTTKG